MEDILTYIIIFGLLIVFASVFLYNKGKVRIFKLSSKEYSYGVLEIMIEKKGKQLNYIIINPTFKEKDKKISDILVEQISKDKTSLSNKIPREIIEVNDEGLFKISYGNFKQLLKANSKDIKYFKIIVTFSKNRKLKSGTLSFNKNWNIYVPDTGTYN